MTHNLHKGKHCITCFSQKWKKNFLSYIKHHEITFIYLYVCNIQDYESFYALTTTIIQSNIFLFKLLIKKIDSHKKNHLKPIDLKKNIIFILIKQENYTKKCYVNQYIIYHYRKIHMEKQCKKKKRIYINKIIAKSVSFNIWNR